MNDIAVLRSAICANPDDDDPRLKLADAIEERDLPHDQYYAEFIRLQVRMANLESETGGRHQHRWNERCDQCNELKIVSRKARELFRQYGYLWILDLPGDMHSTNNQLFQVQSWIHKRYGAMHTVKFNRGLISTLTCRSIYLFGGPCPVAHLHNQNMLPRCLFCDGIGQTRTATHQFSSHPITRIILSDKFPALTADGSAWINGGHFPDSTWPNTSILIPELFALLPYGADISPGARHYPNVDRAKDALSHACVQLAKNT